MRFIIAEANCIECGACRRHCPIKGCIPYENMQHQIKVDLCIGCTICYAVCPVDAVLPIPDEQAKPNLSWNAMERVRLRAYQRGPRLLKDQDQ